MRIVIGIIIFSDLIIRSLSIKAHYSDEGVLPIQVLKEYNWNPYYFSLHTISGEVWFQGFLFFINAIAVVLLIIGYRTRLFTFICWIFLTSLQNRNPFILQGGDDLLRLTLFWSIFLPWGDAYSIHPKFRHQYHYFSFANIGYILLVASVYFFSALLKSSSEWHEDGTAIYYALSLDQIRMPFGTFLYQFPTLMKILTHFVYWAEIIGPILLILPFTKKWIRFFGVILIFILHIGFSNTLYVGLFYLIGMATLTGMLPDFVMNFIEKKVLPSKMKYQLIKASAPNTSIYSFIFQSFISVFSIFIFSFCLLYNYGQTKYSSYELKYELLPIANIFRLEQSWGMFSPAILKDDGWYIYVGADKKGKLYDIKNNKDSVDYSKPKNIVETFESDRWRKFGENYTFNNNNHMRPYFCEYLIKEWNRKHPDKKIVEATIIFMKETTLPDYQTKPIEKTATCNCQLKN